MTHRNTSHLALLVAASSLLSIVISTPTFAVNYNAETSTVYDTIEEVDGTNNVALRFGAMLQEYLTFNRLADRFDFTNDLYVHGDSEATGTMSGAAITTPNLLGSSAATSGSILVSRSVGVSEWKTPTSSLVWYIDGDLAAETEQGATVVMPFNFTVTDIDLHVQTAPTGAGIVIDINENGSSLYTTTNPQISAGATTELGTENLTDSSVAAGSELTLDIDSIGSTTAGADLTVILHGIRKY